ncbi:TadE/TadG family type IV pilus assembly protein [Sulfitobacter aestuariivivens]|uniref:TadE/TadG family type IV pilus assembly protein n=1 Tax=Sulfitobacter aestuariivivens TaxID=2766981 RepID=UPI003605AB70
MKRLFRSEDGFVLIFSILVLPIFFGFVLLIIDVGRGNNAHADLQASADAIALAGARELDGGVTSIPRAKEAMGKVVNSVSMLGINTDTEIRLTYEDTPGNEFFVAFLTDIPPDDATLIDQDWISATSTNDGTAAQFIYVRAQSRNLESFSFNPVTYLREEVPIAVYAVAKTVSAACKIPRSISAIRSNTILMENTWATSFRHVTMRATCMVGCCVCICRAIRPSRLETSAFFRLMVLRVPVRSVTCSPEPAIQRAMTPD